MSLRNPSFNNEANVLSQTNSAILKQVLRNKTDKTGWIRDAPVTTAFINGTRTFTITPTGSSFEYWISGQKFIKYAAESVVIDATEGMWYIYYLLNVLTASQTLWDIDAADKAFVAVIHWDNTNSKAIGFSYELHGYKMPPGTHNYLHDTIGTQYQSGLSFSEGGGGDVGKVGITAGECHDEDIEISITDGAGGSLFEQVLTLPAQIPIYYRDGATAWRRYGATNYPYYDNAGADRIYYNKLNGTWASVEATNNYYLAYWLFATNDKSEPIIAIMGQREDLKLNDAKENNQVENISFGVLPFPEMKVLYRLLTRATGAARAYDDIVDMRSVSNIPGGTYVPQPTPLLGQLSDVTISSPSDNEVLAYDSGSGIWINQTPAEANLMANPSTESLTLSSTHVINSADEDLTFTFGRTSIGSPQADAMYISHRDNMNVTDHALRQTQAGSTFINAKTGAAVYFRMNNVTKMLMDASALTMSVPIAMGGNDISSSGALAFKVSGDNDDYLEFYTSDGVPRIKIIGGENLILESDGDDTEFFMIETVDDVLVHLDSKDDVFLYFKNLGVIKADFTWNKGQNAFHISSASVIRMRPSGDNDDYLEFSTTGGIPRMSCIGGSALEIYTDNAAGYIYFGTGNTARWFIGAGGGSLLPFAGNSYDIGTAALDVREIYHCGLTASSCAIFEDYTDQELYNMLNNIKCHQDGVLERMKDGTLIPHMDMATVPEILAHRFESYEDENKQMITSFERKGFFKYDDKDVLQSYSVPFNNGDIVGIDFENSMWALKDLVLKMYREIKILKTQLTKA